MGPLVQVPFMSSNERFERTSNLGAPGPGAYNPKGKIAISNEKIDALRNRNFGVNAERFGSFDEKEAKFINFDIFTGVSREILGLGPISSQWRRRNSLQQAIIRIFSSNRSLKGVHSSR